MDEVKNEKGGVSVSTENIFPVIKQWLYSEKEIFLRELVSNACDAVTKHKRLVSLSEAAESTDPYRITVTLDKELKTLTVSDNGIGMSEKELSQLCEKLQSDTLSSDSIGLFNINQRLRLHFNEKHCLKIKSRKGFGTTVSFTVPLDYGKEESI